MVQTYISFQEELSCNNVKRYITFFQSHEESRHILH